MVLDRGDRSSTHGLLGPVVQRVARVVSFDLQKQVAFSQCVRDSCPCMLSQLGVRHLKDFVSTDQHVILRTSGHLLGRPCSCHGLIVLLPYGPELTHFLFDQLHGLEMRSISR